MVLTHTLNIKCSPLLGKVAPPVDHHPTHLPITGAGEGEREVEQGELVPVADTLGQLWYGHPGEVTLVEPLEYEFEKLEATYNLRKEGSKEYVNMRP